MRVLQRVPPDIAICCVSGFRFALPLCCHFISRDRGLYAACYAYVGTSTCRTLLPRLTLSLYSFPTGCSISVCAVCVHLPCGSPRFRHLPWLVIVIFHSRVAVPALYWFWAMFSASWVLRLQCGRCSACAGRMLPPHCRCTGDPVLCATPWFLGQAFTSSFAAFTRLRECRSGIISFFRGSVRVSSRDSTRSPTG